MRWWRRCVQRNQVFTRDVQVPDGRVLLLDKLRINQVLLNLLSNAVKYTPCGGSVRCIFEAHELDKGRQPSMSRLPMTVSA